MGRSERRPRLAGQAAAALALLSACGGGGTPSSPRDAGASREDATRRDAGQDAQDVRDGARARDVAADASGRADGRRGDGADPDGGGTKYGADGSVGYLTADIAVPGDGGGFTEHVYVPKTAGRYPVVSFSPGLSQPSAAYTSYVTRLASWGFVVLIRDDPGAFTATTSVVDDLTYVLGTWIEAQDRTSSSPLFGKVDVSRLGLAGHSRGGQATLLAIEGGLAGSVTAWFGVDPVDTGVMAGPQAGPTLGLITIPTAFLGAEISTQCSPADANYEVLFANAPSPSVAITAMNASHTQFEDQASCDLCEICTPLGTAKDATVLAYSVRYLTAFFARELKGDSAVGAAFEGAGAPADVAAGRVQIASK